MNTLEQKKETKAFLEDIVAPIEGERYELRVKDKKGEFTSYFLEGAKRATIIAGDKALEGNEVYFGVAPRVGSSGKKENVQRVCALWIDLDAKGKTRHSALKTRLGKLVLPPTYVVKSGGGYHAYWKLSEPVSPDGAEKVMKALQEFYESDHVSDASRILRVPNTFNYKNRTKRAVEIEGYSPTCVYTADDILAATRVDQHTKSLMDGTKHADFESRSERDYAIIAELRKAGMSLDAVNFLYHWHVLLNGTVEDHGGEKYVERTYEKIEGDIGDDVLKEAIETAKVVSHKDIKKKEKKARVVEGDEDGYFVGDRRISTFTLYPKRLLNSPIGEEVLVCDVTSERGVTRNHPFLRSAFNGNDMWKRALNRFDWYWMGTDKDLSALFMELMKNLETRGIVTATYTSGYHDGLWVTDGMTITPTTYYNGSEADAPMALIASGNEGPKTKYKLTDDDVGFTQFLTELVETLPKLNRDEVILPALSWYMATPMKDLINNIAGAHFPILMYTGTRGSGKTGTVQLFQRLMGYQRPSGGIDCTATKYSIDVLLGSTNGIPVSLTEYRDGNKRIRDDISRRVRLSYDRSANTRGQKYDHNRSIARFDFFAPMTIDGEDAISDPACQERMIVIVLTPETIIDVVTNKAHAKMLRLGLDQFMPRYIKFCLEHGPKIIENGWHQFEDRARSLSHPIPMPARVMNNYAVLFFGLRMFQAFLNEYGLSFKVDTGVYRESLSNVFSTRMGRTELSIDNFITDIVNYIQRNAQHALNDFDYRYIPDMNELWIHFADAYIWWQRTLVQRQITAPGSTRIKQQLKERKGTTPGSYVINNSKNVRLARTVKKAFGVNIRIAAETLDIAPEMKLTSITINKTEESTK